MMKPPMSVDTNKIMGSLPLKLALVVLASASIMFALSPTKGRVVGTYSSDSDAGLVVLELRNDGTYIQYDQTQPIAGGAWRLEPKFVFFKSLVLDGSYRLPVNLDDLQRGKGTMSYSMGHVAGALCMKVARDVNWCKKQ